MKKQSTTVLLFLSFTINFLQFSPPRFEYAMIEFTALAKTYSQYCILEKENVKLGGLLDFTPNSYWSYKIVDDTNLLELFFKNPIFSLKEKRFVIVYTVELKGLLVKLFTNKKKYWKIEYFITNDKVYYIKLRINDYEIIFKNIYLFFPDFEKKKTRNELYERIMFERKNEEVENRLKVWFKALNKLDFQIKKLNSSWHLKKFSVSALSKSLFLRNFNKFKIEFFTAKDLDQEIRPGYFSGRDEIYANPYKNEKILFFDFPSMHANIMLEEFHFGKLKKVLNVNNHLSPGLYFVRAYSDSSNHFPFLANRITDKESNSSTVLYTNGEIEGWFTHESLNYFLSINKGNKILRYYKAYNFENEEKHPIFKDFANYFLNLKNSTPDKEERKIYKNILNSLPGAMGLKPNNTVSLLMTLEEYANWYPLNKKNLISEQRYWNSKLREEITLVEFQENFNETHVSSSVILSIFISSRANIKMHKNMLFLHKLGARILAVKTDSIHIAVKEHESFIDTPLLDIFFDSSLPETIIDDAIFINPSTYSIKYKNSAYDKISLFNSNTNKFCHEDFKNLIFQDFNEKFILIKNELEINSYTKRKWKKFNSESTPLYYLIKK